MKLLWLLPTIITSANVQPKCGLFIQNLHETFPAINFSSKIEQIALPAVAIDAQVKISTNLASTKLVFNYTNPTDKNLNLQFKFPTDVNAAVYKVLVNYQNGDSFEAKIEEKEKAKTIYDEAKKSGKKATMVKTENSQDDILLINLANIPANESATVEVLTSQILQPDSNPGYLKYKLATSLFTRYDPNDDCTKAKNSLEKLYPEFKFTVKPDFTFSMDFDDLNDIDFTNMEDLLFQEELLQKIDGQIRDVNSRNVFETDEDVIIKIKSKFDQKTFVTKEDEFTFISHLIEDSEFDDIEESEKPKEYVLVVDNSGSMSNGNGDRIVKAKESCQQIINNLPKNCSFNIVKFGTYFEKLFDDSMVFSDGTKQQALNYIDEMYANLGGTEILSALAAVSGLPLVGHHPVKQVFVITDGQVYNQNQVFDLVSENTDHMRVFSVGIGAGASTSLVEGIASRGNGFSSYVSEKESSFYKTESLVEVVSKGLIAASKGFVSEVKLNGKKYPAYVDNVITSGVFVHIMIDDLDMLNTSVLEYTFKNNDNVEGKTKAVQINHLELERSSSLHKGGFLAILAKKKLQELQKNHDIKSSASLKNELIEMSKTSNVLCPQTAFVGVMKDKKGDTKKVDSVDVSLSANNRGLSKRIMMKHLSTLSRMNNRGQSKRIMMKHMSTLSRPSPSWGNRHSNFQIKSLSSALGKGSYRSGSKSYSGVRSNYRSQSRGYSGVLSNFNSVPKSGGFLAMQSLLASGGYNYPDSSQRSGNSSKLGSVSTTSLHTYLDLTNSQSIEGSWATSKISKFLTSAQLTDLHKIRAEHGISELESNTVASLVLLEENFSNQKQKWRMTAEKALKWLKTNSANPDKFRFYSAFRKIVKSTIKALGANVSAMDII